MRKNIESTEKSKDSNIWICIFSLIIMASVLGIATSNCKMKDAPIVPATLQISPAVVKTQTPVVLESKSSLTNRVTVEYRAQPVIK